MRVTRVLPVATRRFPLFDRVAAASDPNREPAPAARARACTMQSSHGCTRMHVLTHAYRRDALVCMGQRGTSVPQCPGQQNAGFVPTYSCYPRPAEIRDPRKFPWVTAKSGPKIRDSRKFHQSQFPRLTDVESVTRGNIPMLLCALLDRELSQLK